MAGEFRAAWGETRQDLWDELVAVEGAPNDIYCELLRAALKGLRRPVDAIELGLWQARIEEALGSPELSRDAFHKLGASDFEGERAICTFLEDAFEALDELSGDELTLPYSELLARFIRKFNLRYELLPPCRIMPTILGIFSGLMAELRQVANSDGHLMGLFGDFENAIRDLKIDSSEVRIKTCIQKQMNLLEGIAQRSPLVTKGDLAGMCGELKSWPHLAVKTSIACLYSFASDYPGVRHGGKPNTVLRSLELKDLISMSILLTGCLPYLTEQIDAEVVLWRN